MEASKCPKCGDEPHFVEQVEKWYCYGCNSYVEDDEHHAEAEHAKAQPHEADADEIAVELKALEEEEDVPTCKKCGASLEKIQDGKLFCFVCECSPEESVVEPAAEVKTEPNKNDAQALLDSITVATPLEPPPVALPVVELEKKEPALEIKMCATCGQPMKYIEKYQRHYCYGCRKYAPRDGLERQSAPSKPEPLASRTCPDCGKELKYIDKYSEYYCHTCKKYPLRTSKKSQELKCPKCGEPLRYIEKYSRHFCMVCKEYAPKGHGEGPSEKKVCPCCNERMRFVSEYNEWFCYKCKKYSLRPSKPVLLI